MSDLSLIGAPPGPSTPSNICDYIFSNPFLPGSEAIAGAPTPETRSHTLPRISLHKPLFVDPVSGAQVSWQRTKHDALRIAGGLHALGLKPAASSDSSSAPIISPTVLIHLPNSLAFAPILFGVFASGLTATMANPALTSGELAWVLTNAEPELVVTTPEGLPVLKKAIAESGSQKVKSALVSNGDRIFIVDPANQDYGLTNVAEASARARAQAGTRSWRSLLGRQPIKKPVSFPANEYARRTAVILWSSGTSGKSKGVVLSHTALVANMVAQWHINLDFDADQRWLGFAPFYHIFGLCTCLLLAPTIGATIFVMPKFDPRAMLSHVQDFRITFLHMAPPVAVILAKSPMLDGFDLSSIQGGVSGGAPLPTEIIEQVYKRLGFLIKLGYGLSEAGSVCNQIGSTWEELAPQLGNTGLPLYGVEIKIISIEDGSILPKGQEGEILVRNPGLMNGYLNNPSATAEALDSEGWFHTGDIGKVDCKSFVWITDRLKEVIKVKGFQVSPSELENVLCGSPLVADAAVTGIFNAEEATELPRAYVVPSDKKLADMCAPGMSAATPELIALGEELKKLVEGKTIRYKWLQGNVVFVQQVPKSPSGKILRRLLKDTKGVEVVLYKRKVWAEKAKL
ncbi:hypothetical protein MBLNU459_g7775t2 [Dothideomycetes sp. NU459]